MKPRDLYGILGYPVQHSLSPALFREKFQREGIDADYILLEYAQFSDFLKELPEMKSLRGFNVTSPYKQEIAQILESRTAIAERLDAVNTVRCLRDEDGKPHYQGHNTDYAGFQHQLSAALERYHLPAPQQALIIGTGPAASAVAYVLQEQETPFRVVSRTAAKAFWGTEALSYPQLQKTGLRAFDLIVQATPVGMEPKEEAYPPLPYHDLQPGTLCLDLIYAPEVTRFLALCQANGGYCSNGMDLLKGQAVVSWQFWSGTIHPPLIRIKHP